MFTAVKILTYHDGEKVKNPKWCLCVTECATSRTLCDGVAFGIGDSGADYKLKSVKKGIINCEKCIKKIKWFKSIPI